ncbi:hypothetical protein KC337_g111 [Hortaea werneckii]|nr:hypothetical protein KC337_g111 [Hortaea werneckii]
MFMAQYCVYSHSFPKSSCLSGRGSFRSHDLRCYSGLLSHARIRRTSRPSSEHVVSRCQLPQKLDIDAGNTTRQICWYYSLACLSRGLRIGSVQDRRRPVARTCQDPVLAGERYAAVDLADDEQVDVESERLMEGGVEEWEFGECRDVYGAIWSLCTLQLFHDAREEIRGTVLVAFANDASTEPGVPVCIAVRAIPVAFLQESGQFLNVGISRFIGMSNHESRHSEQQAEHVVFPDFIVFVEIREHLKEFATVHHP